MSRKFRTVVATAFLAASTGLSPAAYAQPSPDFGDDGSRWSKDQECDDRRFSGPGMTDTALLDSDVGHDATDCRNAWNAGKVRLATVGAVDATLPDFGDDASVWSNDDECDDSRFTGPGMTATTLLDDDVGHDATDCKAAWLSGELRLIGDSDNRGPTPDFGDDEGDWSNDDECDDPRFVGPGMTSTTLLNDDIEHDATDCKAAWDAGDIELRR